jgi:hypothetical protein
MIRLVLVHISMRLASVFHLWDGFSFLCEFLPERIFQPLPTPRMNSAENVSTLMSIQKQKIALFSFGLQFDVFHRPTF